MLQVLADEPRAPVEQEQDEVLADATSLFHPSVGGGRWPLYL